MDVDRDHPGPGPGHPDEQRHLRIVTASVAGNPFNRLAMARHAGIHLCRLADGRQRIAREKLLTADRTWVLCLSQAGNTRLNSTNVANRRINAFPPVEPDSG